MASSSLIFKLKSATKLEIVKFEGKTIKARDAKVLVASRIGCSDLEIDLFNGETQLQGDEDLYESTQVEVVRKLPNMRLKPQSEIQKQAKKLEDQRRILGAGATSATAAAPVAIAGENEEERLRTLNLASRDHGAAPMAPGGGFGGPRKGPPAMMMTGAMPNRAPPPGYICHACGKAGHFIEHCPESGKTDGKRYTLPVGIAESNLERVDASDPSAKFVTKDGHWVRRRLDGSAFISAGVVDEKDAPHEIKCPLCSKVFVGAMLRACCKRPLCSPCLDAIVEKAAASDSGDPPECELCGETLLAGECEEADEVRASVEEWKTSGRAKRARDEFEAAP